VARIPINSKIASREFVAEQIRSPFVQRYFTAETRTVAQPTLNIGLIAETPIIVPPIAEQIGYEVRMKQISLVSKHFVSHYQHLVSVFASLQARAFKGEL
jgi:type I restriction enzyme S subunit